MLQHFHVLMEITITTSPGYKCSSRNVGLGWKDSFYLIFGAEGRQTMWRVNAGRMKGERQGI